MKMKIECVDCFMRQAVRAAKLSSNDFNSRLRAVKKAAEIISNLDHTKTPPQIATNIFKKIAQVTGNADGFKSLKAQSNKKVAELMGMVEKIISDAADPLGAAVKISLCGNIIDYGILDDFDVEELIKKEIEQPLDGAKIQKLKNMIMSASIISFFADNAGEIGLDGVLLNEFIKLNPNLNIIIFVKSAPIINDATMEDAAFFNLDSKFKVLTSPNSVGMNMSLLTPSAKHIIEQSDFIIAKGQANYENLNDKGIKNIVFLLRAKCDVVANDVGLKLGSRVFIVSPRPSSKEMRG